MRKAEVHIHDQLAGWISQDAQGYRFEYDATYLAKPDAHAVSLTLPLRSEPYLSTVMFPFFDGLIPEGWLLDIAHKNWKLNPRDRMGLLLACCRDCIGVVRVIDVTTEENS
jgi:serine/threonine-protein kinase HipA